MVSLFISTIAVLAPTKDAPEGRRTSRTVTHHTKRDISCPSRVEASSRQHYLLRIPRVVCEISTRRRLFSASPSRWIDERTGGILISMICSPYPLSRRHSASVVSNCLRHRLSASVTASFLHCSLKLAFITNPIYDAPCPSLVLYFRYSRSCRSQCPREIRQTLPGRSSRRR